MPSLPSKKITLLVAFAIVWFGWGSTYLGIRVALETLPPFALAATRFLAAGLALYALARLRGAERPTWVHWRKAGGTGLALFLVGNGGVVWAERTVASGLVALLTATVPLLVALMESVRSCRHERPTLFSVVGLLGGLLGVGLLVGPSGTGGVPIVEASIVLLGSVCWASGSLYARGMERPASAALTAAMQMLAGGAGLAVAAALHGEWTTLDWHRFSARSLAALAYLAIVGSIIAFSAYMWLLRNVPSDQASTYAYVNPVVAVVLGYLLGDEVLTSRTMVAGAVILASVAMTLMAKRLSTLRIPKTSHTPLLRKGV